MRVLSLFSGIAGLDMGIRLAVPAAKTLLYVERDDYCRRVLEARMKDGSLDTAPIAADISELDGYEWRGRIDAIVGGFPCQDLSNAGKRAGIQEGNRSGLWYEFARIIRAVEPEWVFIENVAALANRGLDIVLGSLAELGLHAEWGVFSAADVGAPHLRKRLFILAHADRSRGGDAEAERERRATAEPGGLSAELAHAESGGEGRATGQRPAPWAGAGRGGTPLADAQGLGGELRPAAGERPERPAGSSGDGHAVTGSERFQGLSEGGPAPGTAGRGGGAEVADAHEQHGDDRGPGAGEVCGERGEPPLLSGSELPFFPPGPADHAAWATVLAGHPDLSPASQPEVRELAGGPAGGLVGRGRSTRVPQLRALGNICVPATAALAWTVLYERLMTEETPCL